MQKQSLSRAKQLLFWGMGIIILCTVAGYLAVELWTNVYQFRRGPYLQSVTPDSVWVVWETSKPSIGQIEYGSTPALGQQVKEKQAVLHHQVQLSGLNSYSLYYYSVNGSAAASFHTAAAAEQTNFRFAVFGDTREGRSVHKALVKRMSDAAPDFVIHTGDMVEFGDCVICWDDFFRVEAPLLQSAPLYPTLGNHEDDQSPFAGTYYFDIFHLPGIERWYAFDYGNARFISLKADGYSTDTYFPTQEQLDWLDDQLATNDRPWTFVFFHWGVFTSRGEDFLETGMRARLVPLFEQYGVNAVFMGHNHGYERVEVNGITYITAAGGGAPLYNLSSIEPGSQATAHAFHFVLLEMDGDRLTGQVIGENGTLIDQFELASKK
jgi:hypothetical protein